MSSSTKKTLSFDEELCHYIKLTRHATTFEQFWIEHGEKLPNLANLVRQICTIPATSVASESVFSHSGYLIRKQRASLGPRTIRHSMMLKYRPMLDKLLAQMNSTND
jgi:hypothetical protein